MKPEEFNPPQKCQHAEAGYCYFCFAQAEATIRGLVEVLKGYATCGDGCTCGDGWDHASAERAIERALRAYGEAGEKK
jgi:hypothetical protein